MNNQSTKKATPTVEDKAIVRSWTNGFAQTCYELEDGTVLAIDYHETNLQIIKGAVREGANL